MEQTSFAPLAVFHGGATRRALQAVTGTDLATLKALVGKALLRYDPTRDRYSIHELLRQYAAERLAEDAAAERLARERHAAYYLAALAEREPRLKGPEQQAALDEIGKDLENVRAAWDWAVRVRAWHLLTLPAINALGYSLQWRVAYEDGLARFTAAAKAAESDAQAPPLLPVLLRAWHGSFAILLNRREEALSIANARSRLAFTRRELGFYEEALSEALAALDVFRRSKAQRHQAVTCWVVGGVYYHLRAWEQAEAYYQESIAIFRSLGNLGQISWPLNGLAHLELMRNRFAEAKAYLLESFTITNGQFNYVTTPYMIAAAMRLFEVAGREERALELYALFQVAEPSFAQTESYQRHFGAWHTALRARLPAAVAAAAEERGRQLELWATVEALRQELAALEIPAA
jgi:tetratricopeptide (TPR) repeat protein